MKQYTCTFQGYKILFPVKITEVIFLQDLDPLLHFFLIARCKQKILSSIQLNENRFIIQKRNIQTTLIAGDGEETIQYLQVVPSHSKLKWADGKVVGDMLTKHGDGNAVLHSVFLLDGNKYIVRGSHNEVLYKSIPILQKIL